MKRHSHLFLFLFLLTIPISCKKYIEQQQQNALIELVTKGKWQVTRYFEHETINRTDSFSLYLFQFNKNGTVYGERYGQQTYGTWSADIGDKTITSSFPSAAYPITLLNFTWTVTDSYSDSVAAKTAIGGGFNELSLKKYQ